MPKIFVGIDLSLTCPGVAVFDSRNSEFKLGNCKLFYLAQKGMVRRSENVVGTICDKFEKPEERFEFISEWVLSHFDEGSLVALEGYSYASAGSAIYQIGENAGLLKHKLWKRKILFQIVEPTVLKKYVTGKGNACKKDFLDQFEKDDPEGHEEIVSNFPVRVNTKVSKTGRVTGTVNSPVSDVIDAYYLAKYLYIRT